MTKCPGCKEAGTDEMGEVRTDRLSEFQIRMGIEDNNNIEMNISCTPDKDICGFHLYLKILSHPGPDKNHLY